MNTKPDYLTAAEEAFLAAPSADTDRALTAAREDARLDGWDPEPLPGEWHA